jgi:hypothetical protein
MNLAMPSERNLGIFKAVRILGRSLREVAADQGISVARVTEICKQVEQWYKATMGDWMREQSPQERLLLNCRLHLERLDEFFHQASKAWADSATPTFTEHKGPDGKVVHKEQPHYGQPRYVSMALRVMREQINICLLMNKFPREVIDSITGGASPAQPVAVETAVDGEVVDVEVVEGAVVPATSTPSEPPVSVCAREEAPVETYVATSAAAPAASAENTTLLDEATMEEIFASSLENANSDPVRLSRAQRKERAKLKRAADRRAAQERGKAKAKAR